MLAKNTEAETGTNWLQATINDVLDLQRKLVDSHTQTGNNQQVRQHYEEAMAKVENPSIALLRSLTESTLLAYSSYLFIYLSIHLPNKPIFSEQCCWKHQPHP